jgi:excisionase family DNA binding protein
MRTIHLQTDIALDSEELACFIEEVFEMATARYSARAQPPQKTMPKEASQDASFGGQKRPEEKGLLIAAKLLDVSVRLVWRMTSSRQMPPPIRFGSRSVRWNREELKAWVEAGCPEQDEWVWP